jgi:hypothetical protein
MKKIRVSEATEVQLDWLVAMCEGVDYEAEPVTNGIGMEFPATRFSTDWSQMGPILDRIDGVLIKRWVTARPDLKCQVEIHNDDGDEIQFGPTLCVAAARCYVAFKLGEIVEVPEELS